MSPDAQTTATLDLITSVRAESLAADGQDPLDEAASLHLKHRGLDGLTAYVDDAAPGFALVRGDQLDLTVAPDHRNQGVGGRLLGQALETGSIGTAWSHGDHPAAVRLADRHGFTAARALWVMRRDAAPLPASEVPADLEIRSFVPSDLDALLQVNAEAFAAHPEQGQMNRADFAQRAGEDWFDPAGLLVAIDTTPGPSSGELLGFHWTKRHSATVGEVYVVGVSPQAQGRGLGRTLTLAGLHHLGETSDVLLYVESDNAPAIRVYSQLGFGHDPSDTHVQYQRT
ncbi:mycothiol synthase [Nocardioides salsibiostraticola]